MSDASRSALFLAAFMGTAATSHFVAPKLYDQIVPDALPGSARMWTRLSGVAELACAAAVAYPRTRKAGALVTAGLFVAVFPANVKMARDWRHRRLPMKAAAYGRLPLQLPLVAWALKVARTTR